MAKSKSTTFHPTPRPMTRPKSSAARLMTSSQSNHNSSGGGTTSYHLLTIAPSSSSSSADNLRRPTPQPPSSGTTNSNSSKQRYQGEMRNRRRIPVQIIEDPFKADKHHANSVMWCRRVGSDCSQRYGRRGRWNRQRIEDGCYDDQLGRKVALGAAFTRHGSPKLGCECPISGGRDIECEPLTCKYDIGPTDLLPPPQTPGDCVNPWTQREVRSSERFTHHMMINKYQQLNNTLMCSCDDGFVMCELMEHLCCDELTGELKRVGERFHKTHPDPRHGGFVSCGCADGEMLCSPLPPATHQEEEEPKRRNRQRNRNKKRRKKKKKNRAGFHDDDKCVGEGGGLMSIGDTYAVTSEAGDVTECRCVRRRNVRSGDVTSVKLRCRLVNV